jgi:hypothetical protein
MIGRARFSSIAKWRRWLEKDHECRQPMTKASACPPASADEWRLRIGFALPVRLIKAALNVSAVAVSHFAKHPVADRRAAETGSDRFAKFATRRRVHSLGVSGV